MKYKNQCKIIELNHEEVIVIGGGCEIQDSDHGKPETLWDKIWDIISNKF